MLKLAQIAWNASCTKNNTISLKYTILWQYVVKIGPNKSHEFDINFTNLDAKSSKIAPFWPKKAEISPF